MNVILRIRKIMVVISGCIDQLLHLNHNKVVSVCYHSFDGRKNRYSISVREFERQIIKLKKTSDFISIDELAEIIKSPVKSNRLKILLTIDDGYKSVLKIKKIVNKHNIPVLLFVISDTKNINRLELDTNEKLLNFSEINKLSNSGWFIGSHSTTHANFKLINAFASKNEIENSKREISNKINKQVTSFAFPKGNFTKEQIKIVKKSGYKYGFSILPGSINSQNIKSFIIPRTIIDSTHTIDELPGILSSTWFLVRKITNKFKLWDLLLK